MIEIKVEIGTEEQKILIESELRKVFSVASSLDPPVEIEKIVVPISFDDVVNELEGQGSYTSSREIGKSIVTAQAKVIESEGANFLVISTNLFTDLHDEQTRLSTYIHELSHLINRKRFKKPDVLSRSDKIYFDNLFIFVDEYFSDRKSYELVNGMFPRVSELLKKSFKSKADGYEFLLHDTSHKDEIHRRSKELYHHRDVLKFLHEIQPIFDALFINISHAFALDHSLPELDIYKRIETSPFINETTLALVDFTKKKYDHKEFDFTDGIHLVRIAMKNFGFEFTDRNDDLICHVD